MSQPDRYAVMGHPIGHSRSPAIHALFAQQTGQSMQYGAIDVTPVEFAAAVHDFFAAGGKGLNVTVPHKEAAFSLATVHSERARRARAVNTLLLDSADRLFGDNTDGAGLVVDLTTNLRLSLAGKRLLLLGAGGAARGVLAPLLAQSPQHLLIANRTASRATQLADEFRDLGEVQGVALNIAGDHHDLVINATSASLQGNVPLIPSNCIGPQTVCYDMAYGSQPTAFMQWSLAAGARQSYMGFGMLVEQAAESFLLWRGVRPDTAPARATLI